MSTYQLITDRIIKLLEENKVPWRQPWSHKAGMGDQQNLISRNQYRGINALMTSCQGYENPYWLSFKQAKDLGGSVKKGAKGTPIVYWLKLSKIVQTDDNGDDQLQSFMVPKYSTVFNIEQCEGIDLNEVLKLDPKPGLNFVPLEECEKLVSSYLTQENLKLENKNQRAYYRPISDLINMPRKETFESVESYYAVLFHEMTHSTGHETRLKRLKSTSFGSHEYSKEELVAELGSAFLCSKAKIDSESITEQSAAYIKSWIRVLKEDPKMILHAAGAAQKATDLILGIKAEVIETVETEQSKGA